MPSQRIRFTANDARPEASNNREMATGSTSSDALPENRRLGQSTLADSALRDVTSAAQIHRAQNHQAAQDAITKVGSTNSPAMEVPIDSLCEIEWSAFDTPTLHNYRYVHNLDTPSAFANAYNQRMLSMSGVGQMSPTMARRRNWQRISKEQLAATVRKDFNAAMVNEQEILTSLLYAVQNQGMLILSH